MDNGLLALVDQTQFNSYKRNFTDFLYTPDLGYKDKVRHMVELGERRLIVDLDKIRIWNKDFANSILKKPSEHLAAFEQALKEFIRDTLNTPEAKEEETQYFVGIDGSFGSHHVTPRGLSANLIGSLVLVEGIATKCTLNESFVHSSSVGSLVRPKLVKSVHYCQNTQLQHTRYYRDSTTIGIPTSSAYPTKDPNGNPLSTEFGLSMYRDHQRLTIQEMPEKAPPGQLPYSVEVIVEDDLVDKVKPGDRVQICGIYKGLPSKHGIANSGLFKTMLIANNIKSIMKEVIGPMILDSDIKNIKEAAESPDIFNKLASSLAPSIFGHDFIKKAILLLLLGGAEKTLENRTHLRGDINILLIGDPSTAKSQMLRFVLHTAPLAINTTGRGSSGVGLTAAVVHDSDTGERRLEAGAMVLADRGVVCIDEFDKMSPDDRVAIHEVMEQQTVTIAKAGIHTSLNARCSVLAAANPIYGQYNRDKKATENIALPDSLLSRFDLLFIVLDSLDPEKDRMVADHVLRMHRYKANETGSDPMDTSDILFEKTTHEKEETPVYQPYDKLLHGNRGKNDIYSVQFIKKYILYAKSRPAPVLTEEAASYIKNEFANLRSKDDMKTLPVTARTLETLIRLATAHAKCRLADEITEEDAKVAVDIVHFALYHDSAPEGGRNTTSNRRNVNQVPQHEVQQPVEAPDDPMEEDEPTLTRKPKFEEFRKKMNTFFSSRHITFAPVADVISFTGVSESVAREYLQKMAAEGLIDIIEETVYLLS